MRLNGMEFPVYQLDDAYSIRSRIAATLNTSVDWLIFDKIRNTVNEYLNDDVIVTDYVSVVYDQEDVVFPTVPEHPSTISLTDAQSLFVASNRLLNQNFDDYFRIIQAGLATDVKEVYEHRVDIIRGLNAKIIKNKNESDRFVQNAGVFENIPAVTNIPHEINNIQFTVDYGKTGYTLLEVFDALVLNRHIPYACLSAGDKLFYKVLDGFSVDPEWVDLQFSGGIFMKTNPNTVKPEYYNALVLISDGLTCTFNMKIGKNYISQINLIDIFEHSLDLKLSKYVITNNYTVANSVYPDMVYDNNIMSELVMNNEVFNSMFYIDELVRPSKLKQNLYLHVVGTSETASITVNFTTKYNQYGIKSIGKPYVMCRVKAPDEKRIGLLLNYVGKLLYTYSVEKCNIIKQYRMYIPGFDEMYIHKKAVVKVGGVKTLSRGIFPSTYSRKCANLPVVVDKDDVDKQTRPVMLFPVKGEGDEPQYYTCATDAHPNIGLRENDLENRELYPALPCCFARDQMNKPGSQYRHYYFGEPLANKGEATAQLYISKKILPRGRVGNIPESLNKLFFTIDDDISNEYYRMGTRDTNSAIEAVLVAKGMEASSETCAGYRAKLDTRAAKQELYDRAYADIAHAFGGKAELSPLHIVRPLELLFDCDIFILNSDGLAVPPHVNEYYKYVPTRGVVLLFYHPTANHTELVFRKSDNTSVFDHDDPVIINLYNIFLTSTQFFIHGVPHITRYLPGFDVVGQFISLEGKCYAVNVSFNGVVIYIKLRYKLPPFAVPLSENKTCCKISDLLNMCAEYGVDVHSQHVVNNDVIMISTSVGDVYTSEFHELPLPQTYVTEFANMNRLSRQILKYASDTGAPVEIDPSWQYGKFVRDGKVIVQDKETADRLLFMLSRQLGSRVDLYENIHDFKQYPNQHIYVNTHTPVSYDYTVYDYINTDKAGSYFYINTAIDDTVRLAYNVGSFNEAVSVVASWDNKSQPSVYGYTPSGYVKMRTGDGNVILCYKHYTVIKYTVLLDIREVI